ncbi:MAG: MFS transporter [Burkholderiaceae bacterium]
MQRIPDPPSATSARQAFCYGLLGSPLAFVALPLYVILPNHYAREFGMPLATLGTMLLAARLLDALIDPLIGRWSDAQFAHSLRKVLAWGAAAAVGLALGFTGLFFPLTQEPAGLITWASLMLVLTYLAYSSLSVAHQSWGARLGGGEVVQSRLVGWREALGLAGVVTASVTPQLLGLPATAALFAVLLAAGWWAWCLGPRPSFAAAAATLSTAPAHGPAHSKPPLWQPLTQPAFQRLLGVFMFNGIASAIPATLVLFFVQDRLQAPAAMEPLFLGSYFLSAALSIALWLRLVKYWGLARTWLCGMALATAVFVWASALGPGDAMAFLVLCALSGVALGTDLALPGAMLAGLIAASPRPDLAGSYFGWWNFATKLNLALAAGISLPLLALFGYVPGSRDAAGLQALALAYCVLPCLLKIISAWLLYTLIIRPDATARPSPPNEDSA